MKRKTARDLFSGLLFLWVLVAMVTLPFAWLMKDGLGPDSVGSSGWDAVVRCFWTFYIGPALSLFGLAVVGAWVMARSWGEE